MLKQENYQNLILNKIKDMIKLVAEKQNLALVIANETTLYGGKDITDEVLKTGLK